jgi:hypothetical protein
VYNVDMITTETERGTDRKTITLTFRATPEVAAGIDRLASDTNTNRSHVIFEFMRAALALDGANE